MLAKARRTSGPTRRAIVLVAIAATVMTLEVAHEDLYPSFNGEEYVGAGVITLVVVAMALAILRYGLYEIDIVVRRTVVYGGLTLVLGAAYVAAVVAASGARRQPHARSRAGGGARGAALRAGAGTPAADERPLALRRARRSLRRHLERRRAARRERSRARPADARRDGRADLATLLRGDRARARRRPRGGRRARRRCAASP